MGPVREPNPAEELLPCAWPWHTRAQVLAPRLYVIWFVPSGATTFRSKLTSRSPLMVPLVAPMPCAVWHTEQLNPRLMCRACWFQLVFFTTWLARSWHLAHIAYGPFTLRSGLGNRLEICCPGVGAWLNS